MKEGGRGRGECKETRQAGRQAKQHHAEYERETGRMGRRTSERTWSKRTDGVGSVKEEQNVDGKVINDGRGMTGEREEKGQPYKVEGEKKKITEGTNGRNGGRKDGEQ